MLVFHDCNNGIPLTYRTDRNLFDFCKLQAKNMAHNTTIRELLFADDCALAAHTIQEIQHLLDLFVAATCRFGLSISLKKTEIMFQPQPHSSYLPPAATVNSVQVPVTEIFCYLGSQVTCENTLDDELTARLAKAGDAFGQLSRRLWKDRGIRLDTKMQVYRTAILLSLLYGSETWTPYRRHIKKLDNFHMNCLRRISNTRWQDRLPNTEILDRCRHWSYAHAVAATLVRPCPPNAGGRIPKKLLYSQLTGSTRSQGGQRKRYKDYLCLTLKSCDISNLTWDSTASDRAKWRRLCHSSLDLTSSKASALPTLKIVEHAGKTRQVQESRLSGPSAASTVGARVHPTSGCLLIGGAAIPHPPLSVNHVPPQVQTSLLQLRPKLYSPAVTVAGHVHPGSECSLISECATSEIRRKWRLSPWCVCVCVCVRSVACTVSGGNSSLYQTYTVICNVLHLLDFIILGVMCYWPFLCHCLSQLETLSRDDLLKFVKKQMLLQQKMKSRCDGIWLFARCFFHSAVISTGVDNWLHYVCWA